MGFLKLADVFVDRAGKGAFLVSEENRFDQIVGDRAAVDGDQRFGFAVTSALDGAGDHFLADAAFPFDQDRNVRRGGPLAQIDHPFHRR